MVPRIAPLLQSPYTGQADYRTQGRHPLLHRGLHRRPIPPLHRGHKSQLPPVRVPHIHRRPRLHPRRHICRNHLRSQILPMEYHRASHQYYLFRPMYPVTSYIPHDAGLLAGATPLKSGNLLYRYPVILQREPPPSPPRRGLPPTEPTYRFLRIN